MQKRSRSIDIPKAAQKRHELRLHAERYADEYAWLKDAADPAVRRYIEAENAYADQVMRPTRTLQKTLYKEIRARMKENDMSVPIQVGPYLYYMRTKKGKQYAIHCRKPLGGGKEEIILDENLLAHGQKFFSLGALEIDPSHTLLAYTVDTTGAERHTLHIKNLKTGEHLDEPIDAVSDVVWAEDGKHVLYTVEDHPFPPRRVYTHLIGSAPSSDLLLFEEKDPQWYVSFDKSRSREYIFLISANFNTTEVRYLKSNEPDRTPRVIAPRKPEVKYFVEHFGDEFYILTNERAVNFKIMRTHVDRPEKRYWKPWLEHAIDRAITGMLVFKTFFVISARTGGSEELFIHAPGNQRGTRIQLPEDEHSISLETDLEFESTYLRFTYQSFLTPRTVFDCDASTRTLVARKKQSVPSWNSSGYVSKRLWATSGTVRVPIVVVHKKGLRLNGSTPTLLEAYGAYGICSDPVFSISKLSLLKRGWVLALAHPRGGGEMGWQWHKEAKLLTKHRTYLDVIACAEHLIKQKYTSPAKLALIGGSAGGMMVGAVLNKRPDLFGAAISYVPAADLINSSLDLNLGGTRLHFDENGDPRIKEIYDYFKRWSPYEGVKAQNYPALLVRANMNDIRTPYWEAAKWVARLRAKKTDENLLLLKTETAAGHFGKSGRYEWIKDRAFDFVFLIRAIGGR